jgi:multiple sugar transport system substrate-binding protein
MSMLRHIGFILTAIVLLSCGAAMAQPKPVALWHVFNLETDMIHGGIKSFNETQTAYRIDARLVPANQLVAELIKAVATGSVPDLVTLDNPAVASFASQGTLLDLTDHVAKSTVVKPAVYFKGPWASGQWKGGIYAVPRDANTLVLCYNADMFRAKGLDPDKPPATWSELVIAAGKLRDPAKNVFGFGFSALQAEEGVFQWLPFLYQAGGSVDRLDAPEAAESLALLADFVKSGTSSLDVVNQRQYEVTNTFMAGNTAMILCGPWELPRLKNEAKFEWRMALLPVKDGKNIRASSLGGYDWIIPKDATNPAGAFAFIEYMADPKIVSEGWNTGRLPPRIDIVIANPQWPQAYAIYHQQLETARPRGPHPQWPDLSRAMQIAIQEAITGKRSAAEALADAAKKIRPILAKTPL